MSARRVRIFVASPGDVTAERDALSVVVDELNITLGQLADVVVELVRWETHTWPGFGEDGQDVINKQIAPYDIFVGIMWRRLGTKTQRAASGTVEEFERAYARWQAHGVPQLMFYFSRAEFFPQPEEMEQLAAVQAFERMVREKGGLAWEYHSVQQFEREVRKHLFSEITQSLGARVSAGTGTAASGIFGVPDLSGVVSRTQAATALERLVEDCPVASVEGLAGSGKTFLVATYLNDAGLAASTFWYDSAQGPTLDDLLNQLGSEIELQGLSNLSRAKELVQLLEQTNQRLVIDDYQLARADSFAPLLEAASRRPAPLRVLAISREYVELPLSETRNPRLTVSGLSESEISGMLATRGLAGAPEEWVRGLSEQAGGLPIAITLFAAAVSEFGRDGDDLLRGSMLANERLKSWFEEVVDQLASEERELLRFLSTGSGPFNRGVVRMGCRALEIDVSDEPFESLQRAHLVENHSPFRWTVHQLIGSFAQAELSPDKLSSAHAAFARHYARLGAEWPGQPLDDEIFSFRASACRHFQSAGLHRDAQKLLGRLARTAKASGLYESFMRLCEPELRVEDRDSWIDYHYAHCALIVGRLAAADEVLANVQVAGPPDLQLSLARLRAELLLLADRPRAALDEITEARSEHGDDVKRAVWAQAAATAAHIHSTLGEAEATAEIAVELLARAHQGHDDRGAAVGFTYLGFAELAKDRPQQARESFSEAITRFRDVEDRRGLAWALCARAESFIAAGETQEAIRDSAEGLRIRSDSAECSPEYLAFLERLSRTFKLRESASLVQEEVERVRGTLEAERRALAARASLA